MNLEDEINEFLSDPERKDQLMKVAMDSLEERIKEQFRWSLPDTIAKECNDFISEHVAPEVRNHLVSKKGVILKAAKKSADEITEKLSAALSEQVGTRLENDWDRKKILQAIIG